MTPNDALSVELVHDGGSLSPGQRIERLEEFLARIADRVDTKANLEDVKSQIQQSENRTVAMIDEVKRDVERNSIRLGRSESGDTMAAKMFLERFDAMEKGLVEIQRHGSSQAQEAQKEISMLEGKVEQLREENVRYNTLQATRVDEQVRRSRFWATIVSVLNVTIVVINLIFIIVTHK